jgi:hypothetical protein
VTERDSFELTSFLSTLIAVTFNYVHTNMTQSLDASDCPGGLEAHEWTPIEQCMDLFIQALSSVNLTGTVLRLAGPDLEVREMTCDVSSGGSIVSSNPLLSSRFSARKPI